jgi:Zn-dependent peptidase ImmA (M78 family)
MITDRKPPISSARVTEIRNEAVKCLKATNYDGGAVDAKAIAEHLGASVKFAPYNDGELAGMLIRKAGHKPVIAVNSLHHLNRRRFTIAHECGHLILHTKNLYIDERLSILKRDDHSRMAISTEEIEANLFAAELLMPFFNISDEIKRNNLDVEDDTETKKLASAYKVSHQAMVYRIYNISRKWIYSDY